MADAFVDTVNWLSREKLLVAPSEVFHRGSMTDSRFLAKRYQSAHNEMRNVDGLQPQEAFDELLKYLFFKEHDERSLQPFASMDLFATPQLVVADALELRRRFSNYAILDRGAPDRWKSENFQLSDLALTKVHGIFQRITFQDVDFDIRSAALREFLTGPVRKGLGIFLTPDEIVRQIVAALEPHEGQSIIDPACGSGTFLLDAAKHIFESNPRASPQLFGVDKNPRMTLLADFNFGHLNSIGFQSSVADSLHPYGTAGHPSWLKAASFDLVLTNPPFGVSIDARAYDFHNYTTCLDETGYPLRSQTSEIVFLERALDLLKPGGRLGIVLPRSVITNLKLKTARDRLAKVAAVLAVMALPPETFAATGTQTTTVVLIMEKYGPRLSPSTLIRPVIARVDNVGFDMTGRPRHGSQLPDLGIHLANAITKAVDDGPVQVLEPVQSSETIALLYRILGSATSSSSSSGRVLGDLIELATIGATPPRAAYSDRGVFLIKVGNLTGAGMSWVPRDRNFIAASRQNKRFTRTERMVKRHDILLTSSAHSSKYIAKKVDIITEVPLIVGGKASFVGEVMLVRAKEGAVDPYVLLAYLRTEVIARALQDRVRGQTAHLHPDDLLQLPLDVELLGHPSIGRIADILRREAEINDQLNDLAFQQVEARVLLGEEAAFV